MQISHVKGVRLKILNIRMKKRDMMMINEPANLIGPGDCLPSST